MNDPLSLNLYTYCENKPIIYADPSGNIPIIIPIPDKSTSYIPFTYSGLSKSKNKGLGDAINDTLNQIGKSATKYYKNLVIGTVAVWAAPTAVAVIAVSGNNKAKKSNELLSNKESEIKKEVTESINPAYKPSTSNTVANNGYRQNQIKTAHKVNPIENNSTSIKKDSNKEADKPQSDSKNDKTHTPDQQALNGLGKEAERAAKKGKPISEEEAEILDEWATEYNVDQHHKKYKGSGDHMSDGQDHTHIYNHHIPYRTK